MVNEMLEKMNLPSPLDITGKRITTKEEWEEARPLVLKTMLENEYGYIPDVPEKVSFEITKFDDRRYCAGKAYYAEVEATSVINGESFTFPFVYVYPKKGNKHKTVVHINFRSNVPDEYMPTEEIIDNGFGCASFCYKDVTSDDGDFTNGLAGIVYKNSERTLHSPGKIAMWAWAAMRVMDFLQVRDEVDKTSITVAGHSRLGKTALLTAAFDTRFACAHSNCAGCSGDALNRNKIDGNETIGHITNIFPFWFCEKYKEFSDKDNETPFDQHFMHALIAPRKVHVASAERDIWAAPPQQFLACVAADEVYKLYGMKGFVYEEEDFLKKGKYLNDGNIGFCYREGTHYFSRDDWHGLMDFLNK